MSSTSIRVSIFVVLLFFCFTESFAQCLSSNDINVNETSVGTAVRTLIDGSLRFSFNLLRALETQERTNPDSSGLFFSPYSIWSALMITYMGAKGRTELELQHALGTGTANKEAVWGAFKNILNWNEYQQLTPQEQSYHTANRVYFQKGLTMRDCIRQMIDSDIDFADLSGDPDGSTVLINDWVREQTRDKIQDLIPPGSIDSLTKMVIANAVYFKENWQTQFDPAKTRRARFTLPSRRDIGVAMMNMRGRFLYGISEELQCTGLELPYAGNDLSMLILLPQNRFYGVSVLANRLTPDKLQNFIMDMYPREVLVSLPKFRINDNFELSSVLNKMGIHTLFDPSQSDLSGFTGQRDLAVDAVHHKSFIDVNEEGTEAAAATAIITSRSARPLGPAAFVADYPFVFLIRDNVANVILFMGTVQKPPEFGRN